MSSHTFKNRSTGPRTDAGKARSSQNARKHGLTAKDLVIAEEEREEFEALHTELQNELDPVGPLEQLTFNQIVHAAWNLRRFRRLETAMMASFGADPMSDPAAIANLDRLNRYGRFAERSYYRAIHELRTMQTNRALRELKPEEKDTRPVEILWVRQLTKRTPAGLTARSLENVVKVVKGKSNLDVFRPMAEFDPPKAA